MWNFLKSVFRDLALSVYSQNSACFQSQAWINSTNAFMNFIKRSSMRETKGKIGALGRVGALKEVKVLSLPTSDLFARFWRPISSFYSLVRLVGKLLQKLHWAWDLRAIVMEIWLWFFQMGWLIRWV